MNTIMLLLTAVAVPTGVMGIFLTFRYRDRVNMTYVDQDCLPLFESIAKNIDGLKILYNKEAIDPSLYFLKGILVNTGNLDIDKSHIHEPLSINLPTSHKWLKAKITKSPSGINADYKIRNGSTLEFKWDLLKANEGFSFNALIKAPLERYGNSVQRKEAKRKSIPELMSFSHRITNLRRISRRTLAHLSEKSTENLIFLFSSLACIAGFLFYLILGPAIITTGPREYLIRDSTGITVQASIEPQRNGTLRVRFDNYHEKMTPDSFFSKFEILEISVKEKYLILMDLLRWFLLVTGIAFFAQWYFQWRKQAKLRRIMKT